MKHLSFLEEERKKVKEKMKIFFNFMRYNVRLKRCTTRAPGGWGVGRGRGRREGPGGAPYEKPGRILNSKVMAFNIKPMEAVDLRTDAY